MNDHYKTILCPVDFSETSELALAQAAAIARASGGELHMLTVIQPLPVAAFSEPLMPAEAKILLERLPSTETAQEQLSALRDTFCAAVRDRTSLHVAEGIPFVEIVKYARENGASLIVMGSHGRTGIEHMLIGSVAERVVRKAPCSVLVVRDVRRHFTMP